MPICPAGFVALGGVITEMEKYPKFGSCYCINGDHAERATKQNVDFYYQIADHKWHNPDNKIYYRDFTDSIKIARGEAQNKDHLRVVLKIKCSFLEYPVFLILTRTILSNFKATYKITKYLECYDIQ